MKTPGLVAGFCLLAFTACGDEKPACATRNAVRDDDGVCGCPAGTHIEVSTCVTDDAGVDIAPSSTSDGQVPQGKRPDSGTKKPDIDSGTKDPSLSPDTTADAGDVEQPLTDGSTVAPDDPALVPTGTEPPSCVPTAEMCDQMDNDCDGQIDNGSGVKNECGACGKLEHPKGESCSNGGQGPCGKPGTYVCMGETTVCNAPPASPTAEACDNIDNDCDGVVDDGIMKNACMGCAPLAHAPKSSCSDGRGECMVTGSWECMGTEAVACTAKAKAPGKEICDKADNDCDGQTDEDGVCTPPPPAATVVQLSARNNQTCALLSNGSVKCWGGDVAKVSTPTAIPGLGQVAEVSAGANHACARLAAGTMSCWGTNGRGQVGDGTRTARPMPVAVAGLTGVEQIAAGELHSCARLADGLIRCWGAGNAGQLGDLGTADSSTPKEATGFGSATQDLRVGTFNTCALLVEPGFPLVCAGDNTYGQTRGSAQMFDADQFSVGRDHLCARKATGEVFCWGSNSEGKVGSGASGEVLTFPGAVPGVSGVVEVLAGGTLTCARVTSGAVYCWGANDRGQIGAGSMSAAAVAPTQVSGLTAKQVVVGNTHACALTAAGGVSCWGDNTFGQLGIADLSVPSRATPAAVVALP